MRLGKKRAVIAVAGTRSLMQLSHLSSAFIGDIANDAVDAKVWYQLHFSASTPYHGDQIVRCARAVASAQFARSAQRMDGRAAIGTEPRV